MRKENYTFHCDPEDLHALRLLSRRNGPSLSAYIREGIRMVLSKYDPEPQQMQLPFDKE